MEKLKYWIWLSRIESLGSIRTQKLLEKYHTPEQIWKLEKEDLLKIDGIGEKVVNEIVESVKKNSNVIGCTYKGVAEFADSSIKYQIKVYSAPVDKVQVRRDSLTCILKCLEEKNIHIPFTQIDIHQK